MDRFTRTRIRARYSRYRHNTLDLHVLENVRSSLALYILAAVITVTAKYLSFVGSTIMHGRQGWPAMPSAFSPVPAWPRPLALAQEASWARTTPPLFDFSVYRARGREGINRRQSSNTWKQQQLYYIFF